MEKSPLDLYTLEEACKLFFPGLPIGPDDLLAMVRKKRLVLTKINRTKLVSGNAIRTMIECLESKNQRASGLKSRPSGAVWVILDGGRKIRTGFSEAEHARAEKALQAHIVSKHEVVGERSAAKVSIAETLAYYVAEHVPTVSRPDVIKRSIPALTEWWQGKVVADVNKSSCNRYVKWRTGADRERPNCDPKSEDTARRDLVVLEAAINFYHEEFILSAVPAVIKPAKPETSGDWLTRSQVAAALWAAWRGGQPAGKVKVKGARKQAARHFARLILIMIYTGTRPGAVLKLQWAPNNTAAGSMSRTGGFTGSRPGRWRPKSANRPRPFMRGCYLIFTGGVRRMWR